MTPTRMWNAQSNCKFIRLYREQNCLWNTDNPGYRDKFCRKQAISEIVAGMGIADLTAMEVKRRIKSLRSTFLIEVKKILESKQSKDGGKVYQSKLSWFKEMNEFIKFYPEENNTAGVKPKYKIVTKAKSDDDDDEEAIYLVADDSDTQEAPTICSEIPRKKIRLNEDTKRSSLPRLNTTKERNEFAIFGMHVASQLQLLSTKQAIIAQEEIQSILTQGRLRDLGAEVGEYSGRTRSHRKTDQSDASEGSLEDDLLKERQYF